MDSARRVEPAKTPPAVGGWLANVDKLKEPSGWMIFGAGGCDDAVASYIAAIEQATCILETLDTAAGAPAAIPSLPAPAPSIGDQLQSSIGLAVAAGVLIYLASQAMKK